MLWARRLADALQVAGQSKALEEVLGQGGHHPALKQGLVALDHEACVSQLIFEPCTGGRPGQIQVGAGGQGLVQSSPPVHALRIHSALHRILGWIRM